MEATLKEETQTEETTVLLRESPTEMEEEEDHLETHPETLQVEEEVAPQDHPEALQEEEEEAPQDHPEALQEEEEEAPKDHPETLQEEEVGPLEDHPEVHLETLHHQAEPEEVEGDLSLAPPFPQKAKWAPPASMRLTSSTPAKRCPRRSKSLSTRSP
jgi:hypothetical protein